MIVPTAWSVNKEQERRTHRGRVMSLSTLNVMINKSVEVSGVVEPFHSKQIESHV